MVMTGYDNYQHKTIIFWTDMLQSLIKCISFKHVGSAKVAQNVWKRLIFSNKSKQLWVKLDTGS